MNVALIVNPIAGMGGKVGLKGTDGPEILAAAWERNAIPQAGEKAVRAINIFKNEAASHKFFVPSGNMGADLLAGRGISFQITYQASEITSSEDTRNFLSQLLEKERADLLIFVGGDGTARDIADIAGEDIPAIGIPAGVKIHSSCYAISPERGGELVGAFLSAKVKRFRLAEVVDLDEELYRKGDIQSKLYGYLKTPDDSRLQNRKSGSGSSESAQQEQIAFQVLDQMEKGIPYLIGPGTTTRAVWQKLGVNGSLLGIDLIEDEEILGRDLSEKDILSLVRGRRVGLIITPTGGQGFLLGRGNHQISPEVMQFIEKKDIIIAATQEKILTLEGRPLYLDTGCERTNKRLVGYYQVVTGFRQALMYKVES